MSACEHIRALLDDLVDGELAQDQAAAVRRHLEGCGACRAEEASLRRLLERVGRPAATPPARDLWPGIAARIAPRRHTAPVWRLLAAAAAVALVSSTLTLLLTRHAPSAPPPATAAQVTGGAALAALEPATADYRRVRLDLLQQLQARSHELSPQTRGVLDDNLRVIDAAIGRIAGALENNPDDRELAHLLAAAYVREIELLEQAVRLPVDA